MLWRVIGTGPTGADTEVMIDAPTGADARRQALLAGIRTVEFVVGGETDLEALALASRPAGWNRPSVNRKYQRRAPRKPYVRPLTVMLLLLLLLGLSALMTNRNEAEREQILTCFVLGIPIAAAIVCFALVPYWIAKSRNHPQRDAIGLLGFIGAFVFGIGWLIALVWAFTARPPDPRHPPH